MPSSRRCKKESRCAVPGSHGAFLNPHQEDGQVDAPGKVASQIDQPLLVALTRAFYWQQLLDDGVVGSGSEISQC